MLRPLPLLFLLAACPPAPSPVSPPATTAASASAALPVPSSAPSVVASTSNEPRPARFIDAPPSCSEHGITLLARGPWEGEFHAMPSTWPAGTGFTGFKIRFDGWEPDSWVRTIVVFKQSDTEPLERFADHSARVKAEDVPLMSARNITRPDRVMQMQVVKVAGPSAPDGELVCAATVQP